MTHKKDVEIGLGEYGGGQSRKQCSVEGCERPSYCRGLCTRCYQADLKNGSLLAAPRQLSSRAKLTEDDVRSIRRARGQGVMAKVLAEKYGVCPNTIFHVTAGRTWMKRGAGSGNGKA